MTVTEIRDAIEYSDYQYRCERRARLRSIAQTVVFGLLACGAWYLLMWVGGGR